jgi:hypothetical protein
MHGKWQGLLLNRQEYTLKKVCLICIRTTKRTGAMQIKCPSNKDETTDFKTPVSLITDAATAAKNNLHSSVTQSLVKPA